MEPITPEQLTANAEALFLDLDEFVKAQRSEGKDIPQKVFILHTELRRGLLRIGSKVVTGVKYDATASLSKPGTKDMKGKGNPFRASGKASTNTVTAPKKTNDGLRTRVSSLTRATGKGGDATKPLVDEEDEAIGELAAKVKDFIDNSEYYEEKEISELSDVEVKSIAKTLKIPAYGILAIDKLRGKLLELCDARRQALQDEEDAKNKIGADDPNANKE